MVLLWSRGGGHGWCRQPVWNDIEHSHPRSGCETSHSSLFILPVKLCCKENCLADQYQEERHNWWKWEGGRNIYLINQDWSRLYICPLHPARLLQKTSRCWPSWWTSRRWAVSVLMNQWSPFSLVNITTRSKGKMVKCWQHSSHLNASSNMLWSSHKQLISETHTSNPLSELNRPGTENCWIFLLRADLKRDTFKPWRLCKAMELEASFPASRSFQIALA